MVGQPKTILACPHSDRTVLRKALRPSVDTQGSLVAVDADAFGRSKEIAFNARLAGREPLAGNRGECLPRHATHDVEQIPEDGKPLIELAQNHFQDFAM